MTTYDDYSIRCQTGLLLLATACAALTTSVTLYNQMSPTYLKIFTAIGILACCISLDILKNNFKSHRQRSRQRSRQVDPERPLSHDLKIAPQKCVRFNWFNSKSRNS